MALPNPYHVKIHRNYTIEDIANLFQLHKNTVRTWVKQGLPVIDSQRPMLILGGDLMEYLQSKRKSKKTTCKLNELYCVSCKAPKEPALNMAEFKAINEQTGRLIGLCPTCDSEMNKFVSQSKLPSVLEKLEVTITTK